MTITIGTKADGSPFTLPDEAVTQTFAPLAKRGVGKTHLATVMAEEMERAGLQFVALDPTGAWWGIRTSADGNGPGLPVIVLGGEHGDIPLESTAGRIVADLVIDHPQSVVLDLSGFESNAAQDRFVTDFAERLYRGKSKHPRPLHLFVDEADSFAPQRPMPGQARMLGAFEAIVRRGRIRGIGVTLIAQRPAVLNKNVLTQTEVLIAMQLTAPQDRAAIDDWVRGNGTPEERDQLMGSLASLERGEAWIWSPAWLRTFERIRVRQRFTFDSSATPKMGAAAVTPTVSAPVDLAALRERMAETIERAKADDPKALKARIAELEKIARKAATTVFAPPPPAAGVETRVDVPVLTDAQVEALQLAARNAIEAASMLTEVGERIITDLARLRNQPPAPRPEPPRRTEPERREPERARPPHMAVVVDTRLQKVDRAILSVLAQYPAGRAKRQIAILTGYAVNGGGFNNGISRLRSQGMLEGRDTLTATPAGLEALGEWEPLPHGRDLLEYWYARLSKAERSALEVLAGAYPDALPKGDVAERAGYEVSGGGFNNALSKLRTLELIDGRGELRAADALFN